MTWLKNMVCYAIINELIAAWAMVVAYDDKAEYEARCLASRQCLFGAFGAGLSRELASVDTSYTPGWYYHCAFIER